MTAVMLLALTLITVAALCATIMMWRNRGGWVSAILVLGLVLMGGAMLVSLPLSQARRGEGLPRRQQAVVASSAWGQTEVVVSPGGRISSVRLPRFPEVDDEQRGRLQLGARLEDGKLVVGGFAALEEPPATKPGAPAAPAVPLLSDVDQEKLEHSLREAVERAVARKLDEFFDKLTSTREVEPALTPLRAALKPLDIGQRRGLAMQLARHSDQLTREKALRGVQDFDLPGLLAVELALCPEGVGTLAERTLATAAPRPPRWALPAHLSLLVAVSALIVATFVLKVATRRHTGSGGR